MVMQKKTKVAAMAPLVQRFEVAEQLIIDHLNFIHGTSLKISKRGPDCFMQGQNEKQSVSSDHKIQDNPNSDEVLGFNRSHHNLVSEVPGSCHNCFVSNKVTVMQKGPVSFPHCRSGRRASARKLELWRAEQATIEPAWWIPIK